MAHDKQSRRTYSYDGVDSMRTNDPTLQAAYADGGERPTSDRDIATFSRVAALLTANGHSPNEAAEIVQFAQGSWSKN
jgi:hypothetical protein